MKGSLRAATLSTVLLGSVWLQAGIPPRSPSPQADPKSTAPSSDGSPVVPDEEVRPAPRVVAGVELEPMVRRMSLEQKVGQLLVLGFGGTEMEPRVERLLREKRPGAVALFARNIGRRAQVRELTDAVKGVMAEAGELPPFVAVDQEGGNVMRLKERTTLLPSAMALGATSNLALSEAAGRAMGLDLRALGFNMNFAPVLDVNSNPANPVIGVRSFGEDPERVSELGSAYIAGLRAVGVAAVAKHFPGHGDTREDSHFALPTVAHDARRLEEVELVPFRRASTEGLASVMAGHLSLPNVTEEPGLPASLSERVLTGLLRKRLGFGGIIMTDGLEMDAVAKRYGAGNAAVRAVKAGADMVMVLWFAEKKDEVFNSLLLAVRKGEISPHRLDDAVYRVLGEKARLGLLGPVPPPPPSPGMATLGVDDAVAAASVTLIKNEGDVVPIAPEQQVLVVTPDGAFAKALKQRLPHVKSLLLPSSIGSARQQRIIREGVKMGRTVDVAVVAVAGKAQIQMVRELLEDRPGRPIIVVSLLSPYVLGDVPEVDAYLCTYSYLRPAQVAAARVLSGHAAAKGHLPVTIPGLAQRGDGIVPPQSAHVVRP